VYAGEKANTREISHDKSLIVGYLFARIDTRGSNAWAKPETQLICGTCCEEENGEITVMTPETAPDQQREAA
jgi:hypothetical protein